MKILVADDDLTSRLMLESILQKWSFETIIVDDGLAAWNHLQQKDSPPIALIDWEMPGMDGLEICRKAHLLERGSPIYTILVTGRDSTKDIVDGLNSGAADYITKPFDNNELRARIDVAERLVRTQTSLDNKVKELEQALEHVKTLQGIIPICMHCHSIRNDKEAWNRLENYIEAHSEAQFSHSICPSCLTKHYPDFDISD